MPEPQSIDLEAATVAALDQAACVLARSPGDAQAQAAVVSATRRAVAAGAELHRSGRLAAAARLYRRVLALDPAEPDALHLSGLVRHLTGDPQGGAELIRRAIRVRADVPWYHANLALVEEACGRLADALACHDQVVRLQPDSDAAHAARCEALAGLGRRWQAILACERAWTLAPGDNRHYRRLRALYQELTEADVPAAIDGGAVEHAARAVARANSLRAAGHHAAAETALRGARKMRPEAPFADSARMNLLASRGRLAEADAIARELASRFRHPHEVIRLAPDFIGSLPVEPAPAGAFDAPIDPRPVLFIAGDSGSFRAHAQALVRSFRAAARGEWMVHVHVVDPDDWVADEVRELAVGAGLDRIAYSAGRIDPQAAAAIAGSANEGTHALRTWHACSRFLELPGLVAHYRRPILMLDLDTIVLRDPGELIARAGDADIAAIRIDPDRQRIWDELRVTAFVVRPTRAAHGFLARVAAYVRTFLAAGRVCSGLDRIALYAVRAWADASGVAPAFHWFPASLVQGGERSDPPGSAADQQSGAVLWSLTGSGHGDRAERTLPAYRAHLPAMRKVYGWYLPGTDHLLEQALARADARDGRKRWQPALQDAVFARVPRGRHAVDIGAHVGFWTAPLAERFDQVHAFEPHPLLQACLRRNLLAGNVRVHGLALGAGSGRAALAFDPDNSGLTHLAPGGALRVRVAPLDRFGLDQVDFVKIDAEGFESAVIEGARATLLRCRPLVLIGQVGWGKHDGTEPLARLRALGAEVVARPTDTDLLCAW